MSSPASLDLRERVVKAYLRGGLTYAEVAERFTVGAATVSRWLRLYRETKGVAPRGRGGGKPRKIPVEKEKFVDRLVQEHPDWSESELREGLRAQHGIEVSASTLGRVVRRLGYSVKKRPSSRPNATGLRSFAAEKATPKTSKPSPLRIWFLWTKRVQTSQ